jgi:hypothetical protein
MKKLRVILPAVAFVMAIVSSYASITPFVATAASGFKAGVCTVDDLDNSRVIGTAPGECDPQQDSGSTVCTVTFGLGSPVTAHTTASNCSVILYVQQ